jgi:hypothetical protein
MSGRERAGDEARVTAPALQEDFLSRLVARAEQRMPLLSRRRPGLFEPRETQAEMPEVPVDAEAPVRTASVPQSTDAGASPMRRASSPSPDLLEPPSLPRVDAPLPAPAERMDRASVPSSLHEETAAVARVQPMLPPPPSLHAALRAQPAIVDSPLSMPRLSMSASMPAEHPSRPAPDAIAMPATATSIERIESLHSETRTHTVERRFERIREAASIPPPGEQHGREGLQRLRDPGRLAHAQAGDGPRVADPVRAAALAPPPAAPPPPVQVSIGRVEIRARVAPPATAAPAAARRPRLALDDYLQQRHGDGR